MIIYNIICLTWISGNSWSYLSLYLLEENLENRVFFIKKEYLKNIHSYNKNASSNLNFYWFALPVFIIYLQYLNTSLYNIGNTISFYFTHLLLVVEIF